MRTGIALISIVLAAGQTGIAQSGNFTGVWKLNASRSDVTGLPAAPAPVLHISQLNGTVFSFWTGQGGEGGSAVITRYPLDGTIEKREIGGVAQTLSGKWEGSTLLTTTAVNGPQRYVMTERWRQSRDGNTLTVSRTIVRPSGDREFVLIYEHPEAENTTSAAPEPAPAQDTPVPIQAASPRPAILRPSRVPSPEPASKAAVEPDYVVEPGTHILLKLQNALNTKHSQPGDRVYLETAVPVFVDQHMVIPRGSLVMGTVTESERAGKVKGKAALNIRFDSLTLPNGQTRSFTSRASNVEGQGSVDKSEGRVEGDSNKGSDVGTIAKTTGAGAGIGTIAGAATGHYGMGAGIGAAAGAAAGVVGVLMSRGHEVTLPAGTSVEMVLDRELRYKVDEIR